MKQGFVKVAAITPELRLADCAYNAASAAAELRRAAELGVKVAVLPELCICGSTCGDLFWQDTLLDSAAAALMKLCEDIAQLDILAAVGVPLRKGGKLFSCAAVISRGKVLGVVPKANLSACDARHFAAFDEAAEIILGGVGVPFGTGLVFECADMADLSVGVELGGDLLAPVPPSVGLAAAGAKIILNLSASAECVGAAARRRALVCGQSARLCTAYVYADADIGESTTDMVFAGQGIVAENGAILAENPPFGTSRITLSEVDVARLAYERRRTSLFPAEWEGCARIPFALEVCDTALTRTVSSTPFIPQDAQERAARCEEILKIQSACLMRRWAHTHAKKIVLGISGGLDSALALLVAVRCADAMGLPRTDVLAVTIPCFGTTARTKGNAERLCEELGVTLEQVDIKAAVNQHFADIGMDEGRRDAAYENSQARERTQVLMDMANMYGGFVLGTGDLSELALGWATYNGDHMSMYGVNASIPKTLVRSLTRHEAERIGGAAGDILMDILDTPVSPELLPAEEGKIVQKTEDLVGPYELHDFYLYYALRWGFSPLKVYRLARCAFGNAYSDAEHIKWLKNFYRRFFTQQFKRSCLPDGPKVGSVTLSPRGGWCMPSDAMSTAWMNELESI